ncbi:aryl-alcohol dehydrogenase-like predicted oxidoreductase [Kineothrix alysoides]|uniref:Aryl-alcohol dehydrogenase-like predicted oxidoreductase n=1 Tax=Kineothrix alysoides TaxID=1469948 RepID=A0A4R1QUK8_9FIRM|nr:aldo/keto reductase [Kineothrix alysoides]TCL56195.1 aryl-alcohol dehydrogenase-like predicted oxidoreductase [Kineothrix alysoides]
MQISCDCHEINIGNLVLGTNFKKEVMDLRNVENILSTFFQNGGVCIDTARSYCGGVSEIFIGRWLKKNAIRENVIISTKAGHPEQGNKFRLSKKEIEIDLHLSLKALKTDYIDLFWLHRDDPDIPVGVIIDYLNLFVAEGKIKFFGASNWKFDRIHEANEYARRTNQQGFLCSQIQWSVGVPIRSIYDNYGMRCMDAEDYDKYMISGLPIFAFSSQAKGYFYYMEIQKEFGYRQKCFDTKENREVFRKLRYISDKYGVPLTYPILSFIRSSPLNAIPVIGCRTASDLLDSFSAINFILKSEEYQSLLSF